MNVKNSMGYIVGIADESGNLIAICSVAFNSVYRQIICIHKKQRIHRKAYPLEFYLTVAVKRIAYLLWLIAA